MVEDYLRQKFYGCERVLSNRQSVENLVVSGDISATEAALELIRLFESR
jgi:hypothetical protein